MTDHLSNIQETLHDTTPTQDPAYPQTDADQKMEARCPNQEAAGVTEQCQPLCFHFNSQDEQNSAQVETRFYFSHSSVVICFQTNSSNH